MPESHTYPLARLVLFMICLAIFGSILAGAYYYAVDIPAQKSGAPVENSVPDIKK
ncbi:MAG: hypothetical protein WC586_03235 [Methanoregula sp.]